MPQLRPDAAKQNLKIKKKKTGYTLPTTYKTDNKDLLYSTRNPSQCFIMAKWKKKLKKRGYTYMNN